MKKIESGNTVVGSDCRASSRLVSQRRTVKRWHKLRHERKMPAMPFPRVSELQEKRIPGREDT